MVFYRPGRGRVGELLAASLMAVCQLAYSSSAFAWGVPTAAQTELVHEEISCWPEGEHIVLEAAVQPPGDVAKLTFHFRWDRHADWYFVPATQVSPGQWQAVMPKTASGTTGTVYFAESSRPTTPRPGAASSAYRCDRPARAAPDPHHKSTKGPRT